MSVQATSGRWQGFTLKGGPVLYCDIQFLSPSFERALIQYPPGYYMEQESTFEDGPILNCGGPCQSR